MPIISIIVPIYRVEEYLERCLDSILAQTFKDFELILVDDGSPDDCGKICENYAKKDVRIKVIHKENGGLSSARNAGIEVAKGKYLLFCDSDDYVSEQWCENLLAKVNDKENNYIFCGFNVVHMLKDKQIYEKRILESDSVNYPLEEYLNLQSKGIVGFAWNVLYYASIIKDNNIRFSTELIVEDLPFNLDYLHYINELSYVNHADYYYIQDERETLSRKYYQDGFRKWQEKYKITSLFIRDIISLEKQEIILQQVSTNYLFHFLQALNNTFDDRNNWSYREKLKYNNSVIKSPEFKKCLAYADTSKENTLYILLLKYTNYYVAKCLLDLIQIKNEIFKVVERK